MTNQEAFIKFVAYVQEMKTNHTRTHFPNLSPDVVTFTVGGKYWKVIMGRDSSRSVYAFIDRQTGDIFKPASWKAPAKHARGNIHDQQSVVNACHPYSIVYLR